MPGVDCGSTFTSVCRLEGIRMMLAIVAEYNLKFWQLDYNTAFLNADVTEEVYLKMAPGYEGFEKFDKKRVLMDMRLLKILYGVRQSPTNWWNTIDEHLVEFGFKRLNSDPCIYTYLEGNEIIILTLLYVDDALLLRNDLTILRRIKQKLMNRFLKADMRDVSLTLGMGVPPVTVRRGRLSFPRKNTPNPHWIGTAWQAAVLRAHFLWKQSFR